MFIDDDLIALTLPVPAYRTHPSSQTLDRQSHDLPQSSLNTRSPFPCPSSPFLGAADTSPEIWPRRVITERVEERKTEQEKEAPRRAAAVIPFTQRQTPFTAGFPCQPNNCAEDIKTDP
ncbi:uncharacterized protein P884DRAFT_38180 [Thermothelomyces heterothallicus CBS 202.75]|uniref:uncharacterized protein n=1 Tax=Thermothelomyces heterothallicus CBS 202.75 TaxID=1149848 RepID=UPI0037420F72